MDSSGDDFRCKVRICFVTYPGKATPIVSSVVAVRQDEDDDVSNNKHGKKDVDGEATAARQPSLTTVVDDGMNSYEGQLTRMPDEMALALAEQRARRGCRSDGRQRRRRWRQGGRNPSEKRRAVAATATTTTSVVVAAVMLEESNDSVWDRRPAVPRPKGLARCRVFGRAPVPEPATPRSLTNDAGTGRLKKWPPAATAVCCCTRFVRSPPPPHQQQRALSVHYITTTTTAVPNAQQPLYRQQQKRHSSVAVAPVWAAKTISSFPDRSS